MGPAGHLLTMLFDIAGALLAIAFSRERFLGAALLARLQIERVALDFLYDIFLLYFALETAQRALKRFPILEMDFCQLKLTTFRTAAF
jgi:hypothetical protein